MPSRLTLERIAPGIAAVVFTALWWVFSMKIPGSVAKEMLAAVLSAAAICAGFLTTAMSILMSLGSTAVGRRLARRKRMPYLAGYLRHAIYGCVLVSFLSLWAFLWTDEAGLNQRFALVLMAAVGYASAAFVRIVWILALVMEELAQPEDLQG